MNGSGNNTYTYDKNGNMFSDSSKNITGISYNSLNLPSKVSWDATQYTAYMYDALANKRRVTHRNGSITKTTDYCGNVIYEDGAIKRILTEEGYITLAGTTPTYHYYLKDHLGNNRVVINSEGTIEQVNYYYPFGGMFAGTGEADQPYKFGGKEFDAENGLDLYDFHARQMEPVLGRFTTMDPLAEKYYGMSPYGYCAGNPLKFVDTDGKIIGTAIGALIGGIKGAYDAHKNGTDVWAGVAEGAVAGAITGAAVDLVVGATVATGGGALVVLGAGAAAGAVGGAVGGVAGDVAGQVVSQRSEETITISTENFASKAVDRAISGTVSGLSGGTVGIIGKAATASTKAVQVKMSNNITSTATELTSQGASQKTVNAATSNIVKGMGNVGKSKVNSMIKIEATASTVTETTSKIVEEQLKK